MVQGGEKKIERHEEEEIYLKKKNTFKLTEL